MSNISEISLGDLLTLERRPVKVHPDKQYAEIGIYCFGRGIFHKTPRSGLEVGDKQLFLIKRGDFILQVTFAWEGAVALASVAEDGMYGSTRFPTFRVNENLCFPPYLVHYFRTPAGLEQLIQISPGSAGRNRVLSIKRIPEVKVPLPSLDEQRQIVGRIEELVAKVEEARGLRSKTISELNVLLPNMITCVTTGNWEMVELQDAVDPARPITYGIVQAGEHISDGVPYIRVSDMAQPKLTLQGMLRTAKEIAAKYERSKVKSGDLVFAIRATVGKIREVPDELDGANLTQGTARIAPSEKVMGSYLKWILQSKAVVESINAACKGSTFREITLGRLRTIRIPLPPPSEQQRIVTYLDNLQTHVEALKRLQSQTSSELDALLPSILDKAFKGEL